MKENDPGRLGVGGANGKPSAKVNDSKPSPDRKVKTSFGARFGYSFEVFGWKSDYRVSGLCTYELPPDCEGTLEKGISSKAASFGNDCLSLEMGGTKVAADIQLIPVNISVSSDSDSNAGGAAASMSLAAEGKIRAGPYQVSASVDPVSGKSQAEVSIRPLCLPGTFEGSIQVRGSGKVKDKLSVPDDSQRMP